MLLYLASSCATVVRQAGGWADDNSSFSDAFHALLDRLRFIHKGDFHRRGCL